MAQRTQRGQRWLWITMILLGATAMRFAWLTQLPPGLTHDEADHGLSAWGVVQGIRPIYFTVGYGREPLYDYATALLMNFLGPTYLAGRLTSIFFSLILLAATYAWTRHAFNQRIALWTVAGLSFSFWSLMISRHSLRSVTLPALLTLAIWAIWHVVNPTHRKKIGWVILSGVLLGATFYSYMPSRLLWGLWPLLLIISLWHKGEFGRLWRPLLLSLLIALLIGFPLFYYIQTHSAEARIDQLKGPLEALRQGNYRPLLTNITTALRLFTFKGDDGEIMWRYNIPGRPWLSPLWGILFYTGLIIALWKSRRQRAPLFALGWLLLGLLPSLITGAEASTTRAIGLLPVLYLFPALTLEAVIGRIPIRWQTIAQFAIIALFFHLAITTSYDYFIVWGNDPQVRVQYDTTRVEAINYLNQYGNGVAALSSPTPDRFHDPSTALMTLDNPNVSLRWFNGQASLLLPDAEMATLIFSGWGQLAEPLRGYLSAESPLITLPMRETDLDRPIVIYQFNSRRKINELLTTAFTAIPPVRWGENVELVGYHLIQTTPTIQFATLWRALQPIEGVILYTHLLAADQTILTQQDRLDVPSYYWHAGDYFIQLHELDSAELAPGSYTLAVGAYTRPTADTYLNLEITANGNGPRYAVMPLTLP